jgi:ParB family chromosome partitioning protein
MKQRKALGRGLGALIPGGSSDDAPASGGGEGPKVVAIDAIRANPKQPRKHFADDELQELSDTIGKVGLMQPIVVRPQGDGYEIISGERRWRASQRAGLREVPIVIRDATEREVLTLAMIENLQRVNLNPLEEAEGYQRLAEEFGYTQEQIAAAVGKDRSTVTNLMRLLKLAPTVQQWVRDGALSMGHARAIAAVDDKGRQTALAKQVIEKGLSVRQLEALLRAQAEEKKDSGPAGRIADPNLRDVIERLKRSFGTKVTFSGKAERGKLVFEYYSAEEFDQLLDKLLK